MHQDNRGEPAKRRIRSFVLRTGRMTPSQERAYKAQWPQFGLTVEDGLIDAPAVFGNTNPLVLEIGFGMGDSLAQMAQNNPTTNFIGVEVHTPGVGRLLSLANEHALNNIRIYEHDAVDVIQQCIPDNALSRIQLFFPDPWHKKKHHKRRIIQDHFVESLVQKLDAGGILHLATDWAHYASHMMAVLDANKRLENTCVNKAFSQRPDYRPITKFERRGEKLGHGVWDLVFAKK